MTEPNQVVEVVSTEEIDRPLPFRRWLILTQYYHPEPGAPQIRLRALARELQARGCDVAVLTAFPNYPNGRIRPEYRGRILSRDRIDGVNVDRQWLYAASGKRPIGRVLCYLSFSLGAVVRSLLFSKPDVVFIEAQPITLAIAGCIWKLRGVPFIYNTPDLQVEIAGEGKWITLRAAIRAAAKLEAFLMKQALCVTTVTQAFIEHFERERGVKRNRIAFLPNGADTASLRPLLSDPEYARTLGVEGKVVFTYAGTHAHYHGLEVIIEAAAALKDRTDIVILMVGQGPLREHLREKARADGLTNVLFRDSPFQDMARLMAVTRASIATVADVPAARKMRLSKVIPPLACAVPVIYSGQGESATILTREGCGIVTAPGSPEDLARAIRRLADMPELCREMGERGRSLVEREYSWSSIVGNWLQELNNIKASTTIQESSARL